MSTYSYLMQGMAGWRRWTLQKESHLGLFPSTCFSRRYMNVIAQTDRSSLLLCFGGWRQMLSDFTVLQMVIIGRGLTFRDIITKNNG